jgi:hypothetical protein
MNDGEGNVRTSVPLIAIRPNPFRDFDLHPMDASQIERLKASIATDGFWTGVIARPTDDGSYELAFGHHRIEAARAARLQAVPIEVRPLDDWQMVRMLATENATQRGSTAAACLDAVAAICGQLVYLCWRHPLEGVGEISPTLHRDAVESLWGKVRKGESPGRRSIMQVVPEGAFTDDQVRLALTILTDSGRMAVIIAHAQQQAEAERAAEPSITSVKPGAVATAATLPTLPEAQAAPPIFDARCAALFERDAHLAAFKRVVTGDTVRSVLPVENQFALARAVLSSLSGHEVTAASLRDAIGRQIEHDLHIPAATLRGSSARPAADRVADGTKRTRHGYDEILRGTDMLHAAATDDRHRAEEAWAALTGLEHDLAEHVKYLRAAYHKYQEERR